METLTYLHHACAYEASESSVSRGAVVDGYAWRKFSGIALLRIFSLGVGLSILSLASAAMALQQGDSGTAVVTLQTQLNEAGCFSSAIDGMFGALTQQGVICFQQKQGLVADGVVGPQTQARLQGQTVPTVPSFTPQPTVSKLLRPGDSGDDVVKLQTRLAELSYFDSSATGHFGSLTVEAVKRFQSDRGLVADGIVGSQTSQALGLEAPVVTAAPLSAPSSTVMSGSEVVFSQQPLRIGSSGIEVEALQNRLKALGFFSGPVTGYYGSITQAAVSRYQQSRRLAATGRVDSETLNAINTDGGKRATSKRYMVVIPQEDQTTLYRVRRVIPNALPEKSRLGDFVNAGTFLDRTAADRRSGLLRERGLDARVAYR